jgi:phage tail sheath protein FI
MPEYLHPGVYVEETSFRAKPIEGVSTSTAGLVGRTRKGPEGRATLVTSFTQFVRDFGDPYSVPTQLGDYLGHAVRAFFENGGRRAYIVRALAADALAADSGSTVGQGTVLRLPSTSTVIGPTDILPLNSLRNIEVGTGIEIWARGTATTPPTQLFSRSVLSYDPTRNTVKLNAGFSPGTVLNPASTFVRVVGFPPQTGPSPGPLVHARYRGGGGNDLAIEVRPSDSAPTRLATRKFQRNRPIVASLAGTGPTGAGANTFLLAPAESAQLRIGDTFAFASGPTRTITGISTTGATLVTTAALPAGPWGVGAIVALVQRGATPAPAPITLYTFVGADSIAGGAASNTPVPHGAVAALRPGDQIRISGGGGPTANATVAAGTKVATTATITFTPALVAGDDFSTTTVRLLDTFSSGGTTRLAVGDVTGLVAPYRATTAEPIAITAGGPTDASTILLVDAGTNQVFVTRTNPPVAGSGNFPDNVTNATWTSFETLQVVGANASTFPVISTAGYYTGAVVEIDDGATKEYRVVTGVDAGNRTITVGTPIPGPIDVSANPNQRNAYIRTLEIDVLVYERDLATGRAILKETFPGLSWNPDPATQSASRYYIDRVNDPELGSQLVTIDPPALPPSLLPESEPTTDDGFYVFLTGGSDGSPLAAVDLVGSDHGPNQRTGIQSLVERSDIALVAVPGVTDEIVQQSLIAHCEQMRYRFAILDGRPNVPVVTDILAHRNNYDTKYAAYYAPWLTTVDLVTGKTLSIPPSGYVLGICARVDSERGVHKAPANETVRGILGVELPFTDGEQDVLNPVGVNLIREFEGRGIRVWGARTLSSDQEWKYVNVRRLFIFLEHSIDNGTQWVVFEPNNEALWARVKATIEAFLYGVWKTGALMGTKPEEAFFVRCDRTTMTQDDLDNGRLVCLIGVAPTYPAEFVIFRIGQFTASSNTA